MGEEKSKKPRKSYVSEIDTSTLLHRYSATTLLALLQEVAHVQDSKIDWNHLVKKTATGITNPREYQMLWRHVAYGDALLEKVDGLSEPLDDDSDLECELEAFPPATAETLAEAAACVKVLIASAVSNDPSSSNVEAPLTVNVPKVQVTKARDSSVSSVQKQPQQPPVASREGLDTNGAANANVKRKRKPWSDAEDAKLIATMQNRTVINWADISKAEFDGDRTPAMLSQRWAILKKKNQAMGYSGNTVKLTEAQLAARNAVNMALDKNSSGSSSKPPPSNVPVTNGNLAQPCVAEASPGLPSPPATQNAQHNSGLPSSALTSVPATQATQKNSGLGSSALTSLPATQATQKNSGLASSASPSVPATQATQNQQVAATKMPVKKPKLSPDSMVKAAAVAAGARIATPSDAATLLKAAQSKNAVHIMPGSSLAKPSMSGTSSSLPKSSIPGTSSSLPSNVHFIRRTGPGVGPKPHAAPSTKPATAAIQPRLPTSAPDSTLVAEVKNSAEDSATHSPAKAEKKQPQDQSGLRKGDQIPSQGKSLKKAQVEGGQTAVLVKASKEQISGDEMVTAKVSNGLSKLPQKRKSEPLPHSDEVKNKGIETVKLASARQALDEEKKCENKNEEVKPEEQPVAMDIDGEDDKQKPADAEEE